MDGWVWGLRCWKGKKEGWNRSHCWLLNSCCLAQAVISHVGKSIRKMGNERQAKGRCPSLPREVKVDQCREAQRWEEVGRS